VFKILFL